MKLVIDISEGSYNTIKECYERGELLTTICMQIATGTPYEERPHGEWIKWNFQTFGAMGDWEYKCSNCEKVYGGEYNFCPNCGADMRGDKNDTRTSR